MDAREDLLMQVESTMVFRATKAQESAGDKRNAASAEALKELYQHIEKLSDDHPLLVNWGEGMESLDGTARERLIENTHGTDWFSRYGFDGHEEPEGFCMKLSKYIAEFIHEQR